MIKSIIKIALFAIINMAVLCLALIPFWICVFIGLGFYREGIGAIILMILVMTFFLGDLQLVLLLSWFKLMKLSIKSIMAD